MNYNKKLSIIYSTCRKQPKFEWFVEYLVDVYKSIPQDEIIFSDVFLHFDNNRRKHLENIVAGRFEYTHLEPKPTMWYGPSKKTKCHFFDASSTRNSGLIACSGEHVVFIDDLSIPSPNWLESHREAAQAGIVMAGIYDKVYGIQIDSRNVVVGFQKQDSIIDGRADYGDNEKYQKIGGGWCFTGNLSVPFEYINKINGFDELYARHGNEDCDFGVRLHNAGYDIWLNKKCKVFEDQNLHWNGENEYTRIIGGFNLHRGYKSTIEKHNKFASEKWPEKIFHTDGIIKCMNEKTVQPQRGINLEEERAYYHNFKTFQPLKNELKFDYDGELIENI